MKKGNLLFVFVLATLIAGFSAFIFMFIASPVNKRYSSQKAENPEKIKIPDSERQNMQFGNLQYDFQAGDHLEYQLTKYRVDSSIWEAKVTVKDDYREKLNEGKLPKEIFAAMLANGCKIADGAKVELQKIDSEWTINDGQRQYLVLNQRGGLKIYSKHDGADFTLDITGRLHQRIYLVEDGEIWAGYELSAPRIKIIKGGQKVGGKIRELYKKSLTSRIYLLFDRNGIISKWFFPKDVHEQMRNNLKSLILSAWVVFPQKPSSSWQTQETDLTSDFLASYILQNLGTRLEVRKKKLRYLQSKDSSAPEILYSLAVFDFDANNSPPGNVKFEERFRMGVGNTLYQGRFALELKFRKKTFEHFDFSAESLRKNFYTTTSSKGEGRELARRKRLARVLGGMKWQDFAKEFSALAKQEDPVKRNEVFRKLAALMELEPDKIPLVARQILESKKLDLNACTMLDALSMVNDPAAQQALGNIIRESRENSELMARAIASLGGVREPDQKTVNLLQEIYDTHQDREVHDSTSLALGNVAGEMRGKPSARAIAYNLEKSLQSTENANEQRVLLESLGNAGLNSSLPHIENFLDSEIADDILRASAAGALRFIEDGRADELLADTLTRDKSLAVRNQTLDAIGYRAPNRHTFSALSHALKNEAMDELRIKEASLLWSMRKEFPQAESLVRRQAIEDPSPKVRKILEMVMTMD